MEDPNQLGKSASFSSLLFFRTSRAAFASRGWIQTPCDSLNSLYQPPARSGFREHGWSAAECTVPKFGHYPDCLSAVLATLEHVKYGQAHQKLSILDFVVYNRPNQVPETQICRYHFEQDLDHFILGHFAGDPRTTAFSAATVLGSPHDRNRS